MIKFGTDGWRARIADQFTFENVARVATGVAHVSKKIIQSVTTSISVLIADFYRKILPKWSPVFFAFEGFQVFLTNTYTPTPVLSFKAKQDPKAVGSVVITASHNPPTYNGFKFKEFHGLLSLTSNDRCI
ncbi:MAG: hypothetical protein R3A45_05955 [Bdellovibrionota bacterium]